MSYFLKTMYVEPEENVLARFETKDRSILLLLQVFYCDCTTSHEAKSLRQNIKVFYYVPSAKLLRKNKTVHPLNLKWKVLEPSLMDSFCYNQSDWFLNALLLNQPTLSVTTPGY